MLPRFLACRYRKDLDPLSPFVAQKVDVLHYQKQSKLHISTMSLGCSSPQSRKTAILLHVRSLILRKTALKKKTKPKTQEQVPSENQGCREISVSS